MNLPLKLNLHSKREKQQSQEFRVRHIEQPGKPGSVAEQIQQQSRLRSKAGQAARRWSKRAGGGRRAGWHSLREVHQAAGGGPQAVVAVGILRVVGAPALGRQTEPHEGCRR